MATTWFLGFYDDIQKRNSRDVLDFPDCQTRFPDEAELLAEVRRVFACLEDQRTGHGWMAYWHPVENTLLGWDLGTARWWGFGSTTGRFPLSPTGIH